VRILWLKTELLHPVDKGGKIRTYQMLKELKREHHITYLTLDDEQANSEARERSVEYCHELVCVPHHPREKFTTGFYVDLALNVVSTLPYAIRKYRSVEMRHMIGVHAAPGRTDVIVCDFLAPAVNMPSSSSCPSVLFQHNVEAMIWQRHFEVQANPLKRLYLREQWRKMRSFERAACGRFDSVVAVSEEDREMMVRDYAVDDVYAIPTGVDIEFFRPTNTAAAQDHSLVFTGSMDWLPNEDAIRYFTEQIMPLVRKELPGVKLTVVGRNPYPSLVSLSKSDSSIVVTGRVEDVRPYMEQAAAYVVPLRIGGGTRLKIYEAMAMEKPVISTSVGAEGLPVRDGVDLLLADTPEAFAKSVVAVLSDRSLAKRLGENAASEVRQRFGWAKVAEAFAAICDRTLEQALS
jgi:sugar transferase (PEP-CTERM/EpsH1 system associated)